MKNAGNVWDLRSFPISTRGVYFKEGNPNPTGTPEEILAAGQRMYEELSLETKEFFDFMMGKRPVRRAWQEE